MKFDLERFIERCREAIVAADATVAVRESTLDIHRAARALRVVGRRP